LPFLDKLLDTIQNEELKSSILEDFTHINDICEKMMNILVKSVQRSGKDYIMFAWWLTLFPGLSIFLTVMGFNLLNEALRDIVDPKSRKT